MDVHYAEIVYVELKHNIFIPNEWQIQGIENLVLSLAEKIIMDPGSTKYILEINNVPAKLSRRPAETGCVHVFQKIPQEEVVSAHLHEVVLPIDKHSLRMENVNGENQRRRSWPNCCVNDSKRDKKSYYKMPRSFAKKLHSTGADESNLRRCRLRSIKRLFWSGIIILLVLTVISALFVLL